MDPFLYPNSMIKSSASDFFVWDFFILIAIIIFGLTFIIGFSYFYLMYIRNKWAKNNLRFIILAIDIPKANEQSPKATENMFTYLAGAHSNPTFFEKWFEGRFQVSFSYELISLEGYTQFLIRTPIEFRNLIETSVYSQYPDAEIIEVDDYVEALPHRFPDEEYDVWGTEFMLAKPNPYPIKMYREFEHISGPSETQFKDPMALLMDLYSSLGLGEQLWLQMILVPIGFDWIKESEKEAAKVIGRKPAYKKDMVDKFVEAMGEASEFVYPLWGDIEDKPKKEERQPSMMELTPKQKKQIEAIEDKASKLAFEVKIRAVYIAKKEVLDKSKVASGMVGYMKQFIALDLNNLMPDVKGTLTRTNYFAKSKRLIIKKNNIVRNYVNRDDFAGTRKSILNIEELATLWHFPIDASVRAPLIQKAPGRKADAPSSLPMLEDRQEPDQDDLDFEFSKEENKESKNNQVPENLPFIE
jgi:hypothetical protein